MGDVTLKRTGVFGLWKSKNATVNWRGRGFKAGALLKIVSVHAPARGAPIPALAGKKEPDGPVRFRELTASDPFQ